MPVAQYSLGTGLVAMTVRVPLWHPVLVEPLIHNQIYSKLGCKCKSESK